MMTTTQESPSERTYHSHRRDLGGNDNDGSGRNDDDSACTTIKSTPRLLRRYQTIAGRKEPPKVNHVSFVCGLAAGVTQAGLFNPIDRALYLSIKNEIPFLRWENFHHPYQGFLQSVGHRALSGGLYYPLEHFFMNTIPVRSVGTNDDTEDVTDSRRKSARIHHLMAGMAAGTVNAVIVNPIAAVKYKTWGRDANRGIGTEIYDMLRKGGLRPFANGLVPTVLRDLVFGGCYTFLRLELQYRFDLKDEYQWSANLVAAALATVVSGPFNLARNVQYGTKSRHVADTVAKVFQDLIHETMERPTLWTKWVHIQSRLRLGWGTARVAVGMAFGHAMYDQLHGMYEEWTNPDRGKRELCSRQ